MINKAMIEIILKGLQALLEVLPQNAPIQEVEKVVAWLESLLEPSA